MVIGAFKRSGGKVGMISPQLSRTLKRSVSSNGITGASMNAQRAEHYGCSLYFVQQIKYAIWGYAYNEHRN